MLVQFWYIILFFLKIILHSQLCYDIIKIWKYMVTLPKTDGAVGLGSVICIFRQNW